jgi:predicted secreted protein
VFARSGTAWSQVARVLASDQNSYDVFGAAVALSGPRLLVGAPGKSAVAKSGAGAAYVRLLGATKPSVTLKAVPTSLRAGKSVTFSGAVKSPVSGYQSLVLKRKSGARWIVLKTLTIGRSGGYSWRMRTTKSGKLQVVATYVVGVGAYSSKQVTVKVL